MKTFKVVALFFFFFNSGFSQSYIAFPNSNAYWREVFTHIDGGPTYQYTYNFHYFINGDTAVNGLIYHKIYKTGNVFIWPVVSGLNYSWQYYNNEFCFGLREDSLKKIYINHLGLSTVDELLYDFNLSIGDTLQTFIGSGNIVSAIDSILTGNQYRKRYWLNYPLHPNGNNHAFIIEGIGSNLGLANGISPFFEAGGMLLCFIQDSQQLYMDSVFGNCQLVNLHSSREASDLVNLFPNPASTSVCITFENNSQEGETIVELIDVKGKICKSENHDFFPVKFSVAEFSRGLYFVQIRNNNIITRKKIILY